MELFEVHARENSSPEHLPDEESKVTNFNQLSQIIIITERWLHVVYYVRAQWIERIMIQEMERRWPTIIEIHFAMHVCMYVRTCLLPPTQLTFD